LKHENENKPMNSDIGETKEQVNERLEEERPAIMRTKPRPRYPKEVWSGPEERKKKSSAVADEANKLRKKKLGEPRNRVELPKQRGLGQIRISLTERRKKTPGSRVGRREWTKDEISQ